MQSSDDGGDDDDDEEVQVVEKDSQEGIVFAQSPLFSGSFLEFRLLGNKVADS